MWRLREGVGLDKGARGAGGNLELMKVVEKCYFGGVSLVHYTRTSIKGNVEENIPLFDISLLLSVFPNTEKLFCCIESLRNN